VKTHPLLWKKMAQTEKFFKIAKVFLKERGGG